MDGTTLTMSIAALIASIAALVTSAVLATRQIRTAQRANQLPVVFEIFRFLRSGDVRQKEDAVRAELPQHDPVLGFRNLPEPLRGHAQEVCSYYNMVGYLVMLRVVDERIAILPLYFRSRETWTAVEPFVRGERLLRNDENSFMNGYESLIARIDGMDVQAALGKAQPF
jgi:hypothetical protein